MNVVIKDFLGTICSLHELKAENLPDSVLTQMRDMNPEELYRTCTQLVILQYNIPTNEKLINLSEDEILTLSQKYASELLERIRG